MTFTQTYLIVALGIVISVLLPILRQFLPRPPKAFGVTAPDQKMTIVRQFAVLGLVSLLTALLIMAFAAGSLNTWRDALLAGYAWDSTLQKIGQYS
ncbi:MAG: hypothetical protein ACLQMT_08160 [Candidatus Acidiferrales bacterium]